MSKRVPFNTILCIFAIVCYIAKGDSARNSSRSFEVDYEHDRFLKDGEPFRYISGSLHYFRVPRFYWRDRLRKLRAAGLNAVSTYVEWSSHEPLRGLYDFTGDNDVEHFVKLAEEEGLLVILRPGPYICAERDLGGYPPWLLSVNPNMYLRTNDSSHTEQVHRWLSVLLPRMQPLLYGNGGPIIMVQVENEYGSYFACDRNYTTWLRDVFHRYIGNKALLFTTDGFASYFLKCGPIPGVFITVDFSIGKNVTDSFQPLRRIQPHGPLVNSEFYPGWLSHWGEPKSVVNTTDVVKTTQELLANNASFNYYMFFGGTNFDFKSGANNPPFLPQITSYDYDAPMTEAGDLTDKYYAIKSVISEHIPVVNISVKNSTKTAYGTFKLEPKVHLFDSDLAMVYPNFTYPVTFEALHQYRGFVLYETVIPDTFSGRGLLIAGGIHDRALVYVNKEIAGVLSRMDSTYTMLISGKTGETLSFLVENQGHINYGNMFDLKGLTENVTLNGEILTGWKHTGFPVDNVSLVSDLPIVDHVKLPAFYSAKFQLPASSNTPNDTFVNMAGWTKGQLYVNDHNLGRFWPQKCPQTTLYLPGPFLKSYPDYNVITILELEHENPSRTVEFVSDHIWTE